MNIEILKSITLNIVLLVIIAEILARIPTVKKYVISENHTVREQFIMILLFGGIGIISTYTGHSVNGAYANTRVIGVMAGGFIGGPIVGIGAALIAGTHRYLIDINGFSAVACTISTIAEGIIASFASEFVRKRKYKSSYLFFLTLIAEILQMLIILIFASPFSEALDLVREIVAPMGFLNPIGLVLFVGIFKHILTVQEYEAGAMVKLTLDITKKCLTLLRKGKYDEDTCDKIGDVILEFSKDITVMFTDTKKILSVKGRKAHSIMPELGLPDIARQVIENDCISMAEKAPGTDSLFDSLNKMTAIGAPLTKHGEVFGCMIILSNKYQLSYYSSEKFVDGLCELFSVQYELADVQKQHELLVKSEFHALQSQINPHFIFNSLNTISAFCREKPDTARELLIALATYFRNSIQTQDGFVSLYDEMEYVDAYLQLEKARFDDRLEVTVNIPDNLDCKMPCLILQPIVENAVKHGAMKRKFGKVKINASQENDNVKISVEDNGLGIPEEVILGLYHNKVITGSIGLSNVQKRLCYAYGEKNGLDIQSSPEGTIVTLSIPKILEVKE